jgi:NAD(P)-dependent dehydrogenase (short-subunit alcohol dehydrogenase family)
VTQQLRRFADKVVIVTGAGHGIGRAIAERFGAEGARVVVNDVRQATADATAQAIIAAGGQALAIAADVSSKAAVDAMFDAALAQFGTVDVLVNNAGLTDVARHFLEGDEEWWDRVIDVNLKGVFLCSHRAAHIMARKGKGSIISLSSGGATRAHRGLASYDASKGGIEALTRAMALDLGPYGIRCNAVVPGSINTGAMSEEAQRQRGETVPAGRVGVPEDLAGPTVFLASDDADYVTGAVLVVDGGMLAQQRSAQVDIFPLSMYPKIDVEG